MKRLLLIALCSVACVPTAQEGEQMRADIAALRADLKKEMDATSADRQKDQQRAKALQDALDQLSRAARKSGADLAVDVEKNQNDLAALRGQLEVIQHKLEALEKASADQQKSLDPLSQFVTQQKKEQERPTERGALLRRGVPGAQERAGGEARARPRRRVPQTRRQGQGSEPQPVAAQQAVLHPLHQRDQIAPAELSLRVLLEGERGVDQVAGDEVRRLLLQPVGQQAPVLLAAAEAVDQLVLAQHLLAGELAGHAVGLQLGPVDPREHARVAGLQRGVEPFLDARGELPQVVDQLLGDLVEDVVLQLARLLVEDLVPAPHRAAFYGAPGN